MEIGVIRGAAERIARIDTPPAPAKAPAGLTRVRFTRPFPGVAAGMDRIGAFGKDEVTGLTPHAAEQVISYAVADDEAA